MCSNISIINTSVEIEKELLSLFKKNDKLIIFDIGSCDGIDSIRYSKLFPKSIIYAFEPLEENILLLKKNLSIHSIKNVFPFQIALSDKNGLGEFYISSGKPENLIVNDNWDYGNKSSSLLAPWKVSEIFPWLKFESKKIVKTRTLLSFCIEHEIKRIDFIHLDVQGAEIMVLSGAEYKLTDIKAIWTEVEQIDLYKCQPLKEDIETFLLKNGFSKIKDTVNDVFGDQFWVNQRYYPERKMKQYVWKTSRKFLKLVKKLTH